MKVALLLSGQYRDGDKTLLNLKKNLLDKYNVDIFISNNYDDIPEVGGEFLKKLYNPKGIVSSKYSEDFPKILKNCHYYSKHPETNPETVFRMWYSIKQANLLKSMYESENGFKYDIVIKSRFDLDLIDENIFLKTDKNTIFIPIGWDHRDGCNDLFAYGDSDSMSYYCNLYYKLLPYLEEDGQILHPEGLLKHHLNISDISVMRTSIKMLLRDMKVYELDYRIK